MYTLPVSGADAPQMPRFDDGMVDMRELLRAMAESLVNENMDAQAEDACADGNQRNGYRERRLITSVGTSLGEHHEDLLVLGHRHRAPFHHGAPNWARVTEFYARRARYRLVYARYQRS